MARTRNNRRGRRQPRTVATSTVISGSQELAQITVGTPSGTFVGGQIPLIPTFEPGSRLSLAAVQFSQYNIEVSRVSFVSQTSTNSSGRLTLAWTFDPLESNPVSCHQILQISQSRMCPIWKNISTTMPRSSPEKRRFAVIEGPQFAALPTEDKQQYLPATLIFGSDGSAQSGLTVGSLIWHYRIRFYNPNFVIGATLTSYETLAPPVTSSNLLPWATIEPPSDQEEGETRIVSK